MDLFKADAGNVLHPQTALISTVKTLPDYLNGRVLHQKYVVEGLSLKQIATLFASSKDAVLRALRAEGIPLRAHGQHHGRPANPAYGKRIVRGRLVDCPAEQRVIKLIKKLASDGDLTATGIARRLTEMGIAMRNGKTQWHHEQVRSILKRNGQANLAGS